MTKQALRKQQELMQVASEFAAALTDFAKQPSLTEMDRLGEILENLERPMRENDYADDDDRAIELLRALEMHGEGLSAYREKGFKFEAGDVLITAARQLAVVTAVNKKGEIQEAMGASTSKSVTGGKFVLTWRPTTKARHWPRAKESVTPAYADLDAALVYAIRQWSTKQSDEGRDVSTGAGFFLDLAKAPGLKLRTGDLSTYSEQDEVMAFCDVRGGTASFPDATPVAGDFALLRRNKAWGVVIRRHEDGTVDIVAGGVAGKGPLGEPAGAVRVLRGIGATEIDRLWRPAVVTPKR